MVKGINLICPRCDNHWTYKGAKIQWCKDHPGLWGYASCPKCRANVKVSI